MPPRLGPAPGSSVPTRKGAAFGLLLLSIALLYLTAPAVAVEEEQEGESITLPFSDDAIIAFGEERAAQPIHPVAIPVASEYAAMAYEK